MGEDLVLRDEGRGRVLEDHQPGVEPDAGARNAGRPPLRRGVEQERGPPLADRAELGDRDLREVERERDRLAVEVAAADHEAAAGRAARRSAATPPSGKTSGLSVALFISMSRTRRRWSRASRTAPWTCGTQRSEYGSWTLWASPWWLGLERRVAEEVAQLGGDRDLAGMRPGELVGRGERDVRAEQRLDAASPRRRSPSRRADRRRRAASAPSARHQLRPVEEGEPLLRLERRAARARPRASATSAGHAPAAELDLAAPDQRQREMGQRREVAGRADASPAPARPDGCRRRGRRAGDRRAPAGSRCGRARACSPGAGASPGRSRAASGAPDARGVAHQEVLLEARGVGRRDRTASARAPNPVVTP